MHEISEIGFRILQEYYDRKTGDVLKHLAGYQGKPLHKKTRYLSLGYS